MFDILITGGVGEGNYREAIILHFLSLVNNGDRAARLPIRKKNEEPAGHPAVYVDVSELCQII